MAHILAHGNAAGLPGSEQNLITAKAAEVRAARGISQDVDKQPCDEPQRPAQAPACNGESSSKSSCPQLPPEPTDDAHSSSSGSPGVPQPSLKQHQQTLTELPARQELNVPPGPPGASRTITRTEQPEKPGEERQQQRNKAMTESTAVTAGVADSEGEGAELYSAYIKYTPLRTNPYIAI